ncbi:MAG: hypothetical protein CSA65_04455 [Proteobacteria bacterium]|nr:MAG: hypothetical protein CSA65_04455 [Pseudomonadota bacterium]
MGFLSPLLLLGLVAASLPLLIHLIGKQRAQRVPFAALDFLLRHDRRLRRRLRLRQLLLLALRVALLVAVALMLARPYAEVPSTLPSTGSTPIAAAIIIDDTASMAGRLPGGTLLDEARRRALTLVDQLPPGSLAVVVRATASAEPHLRLDGDRRTLRRAIQRIPQTARAAHLDDALLRARRLLAGATAARHLFVFTDLAKTSLPRTPPRPGRSKRVHLHAIDVAPAAGLSNRAIVALSAHSSSAPGHRSMQLRARVCRFGGRAAPDAPTLVEPLSLTIDGKLTARGSLRVPSSGCAEKTFDHAFARPGVHRAVVALSPDALPLDDHRHLQLEVAGELRVLLVNGDPSPLRHADELFYLRAALETAVSGQQRIVARVLTPAELSRARFTTFDVVVLANVADLSSQTAAALDGFVRGGGGLLITVGSNTRAARYARRLSQLLPQQLRSPISPSPSAGAGQLRLGRVDTEHPLFSGAGAVGLAEARFSRVFRLRPSTRPGRRVLLRYDDGSPLLVEARYGAGRTMLLTTTIDRDWSDLAIRPGYLPLVQGLARYLAGAADQRIPRSLLVGARAQLTFPQGMRRLRVAEPGGVERSWDRGEADAEGRVSFVTEGSGFFRVTALDANGEAHLRPRDSFAVNTDPSESDTRKGQLGTGGPAAAGSGGGGALRRVPLWHGLGALLLLLLFGESLLTRRG